MTMLCSAAAPPKLSVFAAATVTVIAAPPPWLLLFWNTTISRPVFTYESPLLELGAVVSGKHDVEAGAMTMDVIVSVAIYEVVGITRSTRLTT